VSGQEITDVAQSVAIALLVVWLIRHEYRGH
jgi:hypothetical protein